MGKLRILLIINMIQNMENAGTSNNILTNFSNPSTKKGTEQPKNNLRVENQSLPSINFLVSKCFQAIQPNDHNQEKSQQSSISSLESEDPIMLEPFGMQDTCYPQIFPLGHKSYGCIYQNCYAIIKNDNNCKYIKRHAPILSQILYANITENANTLICVSICRSTRSPEGQIYGEIVWYKQSENRQLKRVVKEIPFTSPFKMISLSILQHSVQKDFTHRQAIVIITRKSKIEESSKTNIDFLLLSLEAEQGGKKSNKLRKWEDDAAHQGMFHYGLALQLNEILLGFTIEKQKIYVFTRLYIREITFEETISNQKGKHHEKARYQFQCELIEISHRIKEHESIYLKHTKINQQKITGRTVMSPLKLNKASKVEVLGCCLCSNRIFILASNHILYELENNRIVNREDLIAIISQNIPTEFVGERVIMKELHSIGGVGQQTDFLIIRALVEGDQYYSTKFFTFKVNRRWVQHYSKIEFIEEHFIHFGVTLTTQFSSHRILKSKIKSVKNNNLSIFNEFLLQSEHHSDIPGQLQIALQQLFIISKLDPEKMSEEQFRRNMRLGDHSLKDFFRLRYYPPDAAPSHNISSSIQTDKIVNNYSDKGVLKIRNRSQINLLFGPTGKGQRQQRGQIFQEPYLCRFPLLYNPTSLSIDPLALKVISCNHQKIQEFFIMVDHIVKGEQLPLKEICYVTYTPSGKHIIAHSLQVIYIVDGVTFEIVRVMPMNGEIIKIKVTQMYIIIKWKQQNNGNFIISICYLNLVILPLFPTFSIVGCKGDAEELIDADPAHLFLVTSHEISVLPIMLKKFRQVPEDQQYLFCNQIFESINNKKVLRFHHSWTDICAILQEEGRVRKSFDFENEGEKSTALVVWESYIFVGTNLGQILIYKFKSSSRLKAIKLEYCAYLTASPLHQLFISEQNPMLLHAITTSDSILSLKVILSSNQNTNKTQFKPKFEAIHQITMNYCLLSFQKFNSYNVQINELELVLLRLMGDLEEMSVKVRPALKGMAVAQEKTIQKSIIDAKIEEGSLNIQSRKNLIKLRQFYDNYKKTTEEKIKTKVVERYNQKIGSLYNQKQTLIARLQNCKEFCQNQKQQLRRNLQKEFTGLVGQFQDKIDAMKAQINKLEADKVMDKLVFEIDVKFGDDEIEILKQKTNVGMREESHKLFGLQQRNRRRCWTLAESIKIQRDKNNQLHHLIISFKRENAAQRKILKEKQKKYEEIKMRIKNAEIDGRKAISRHKFEEVVNQMFTLRSEAKGIQLAIEDSKCNYEKLRQYHRSLQGKINSLSEDLSLLITKNSELSQEISQKNKALAKLKDKFSTLKEKKLISKHKIEQMGKEVDLKEYEIFRSKSISLQQTQTTLVESTKSSLALLGKRAQYKEIGEEMQTVTNNIHTSIVNKKIVAHTQLLIRQVNAQRELFEKNKNHLEQIRRKATGFPGLSLGLSSKKKKNISIYPDSYSRQCRVKSLLKLDLGEKIHRLRSKTQAKGKETCQVNQILEKKSMRESTNSIESRGSLQKRKQLPALKTKINQNRCNKKPLKL